MYGIAWFECITFIFISLGDRNKIIKKLDCITCTCVLVHMSKINFKDITSRYISRVKGIFVLTTFMSETPFAYKSYIKNLQSDVHMISGVDIFSPYPICHWDLGFLFLQYISNHLAAVLLSFFHLYTIYIVNLGT